jgi:excisionase family DNA binding protein
MTERYVTRRQLASRWNVSLSFVAKLLARGKLPVSRLGKRVLIKLDEAEALLESGELR